MTELIMNTTQTDQQRSYSENIYKSGKILLNIINDILDFSKIEAGKLNLENTPFNLDVTLETIISMFSNSVIKKNLELIYKINPNVPIACCQNNSFTDRLYISERSAVSMLWTFLFENNSSDVKLLEILDYFCEAQYY